MLNLLLMAALTPIAYGFAPDTRLNYEFNATFEGLIPILGGQEGKAEVQMAIDVLGLKADEGGNLQVSSEIRTAKILFNDAPLPLTLDSIKGYFPKTTISVTPLGKTVKTDAPTATVPVKLPGLDARRFADVVYIPLEFPAGGVTVGQSWTFRRTFGDSDMVYACTPIELTDSLVKIGLKVSQTYEALEDAGLNIVTNEKDAANRVKTTMSGEGSAEFDRKLGVFRLVRLKASAESVATDVQTKEVKTRKLASVISVKLKVPGAETAREGTQK